VVRARRSVTPGSDTGTWAEKTSAASRDDGGKRDPCDAAEWRGTKLQFAG